MRPLRSLLACLALALASPAIPQASAPIPVDKIARAKFPREIPEKVDALAELNRMVNASLTYTSDREHYGFEDVWVMVPDDGKGDCEDYALSKLFVLSEAGFPTVSNVKIVTVEVKHEGKVYGHAILAVRLPRGSVAYLDMGDEPMTRRELEQLGYHFFDWRP